jgi:hypothetical protein
MKLKSQGTLSLYLFCMKRTVLCLVYITVLHITEVVAASIPVFAPSANETAEGDSALGLFAAVPSRFQQVYSASEFLGILPAGGGDLNFLNFRTDGPLGINFFSSLSNAVIIVSTTTRNPDQLATTFADNLGADATTVFGQGTLALSGAQ